MKALFARVSNIKSFPSTGSVRVEIEAPVEQFPSIVALLHNQAVLVTIAPKSLPPAYGVVDAPEEEADEEPAEETPRSSMGARCKWAVMRCRDPLFQEWIVEEFFSICKNGDLVVDSLSDESLARALILKVCGIESRNQLDTDSEAAKIFDEKIRVPFAREYGERR